MNPDEVLEIAITVDAEAAEAVSELFNRYNGGGYDEDNAAGEAGGGGAVIEATGFDDFGRPLPGEHRIVVKTYIKPGARGTTTRRQIEEGLWRLSLIYPMPEPEVRIVHEEDWAYAWKKYYKPLRIGARVVLKPTWEEFTPASGDLVVELDPGMAFGTGLHPSTRLCIRALEMHVHPGDAVLDLGTGSGVLAIVAAKLGAARVLATDIDPLAVHVAAENSVLNGYEVGQPGPQLVVQQGSIPAGQPSMYQVIVANILAEVLAGLFDGTYGNVPLAEPLAPGGVMILSGILDDRAAIVIEAATRHGLDVVDRLIEGDWVALVVQRPA